MTNERRDLQAIISKLSTTAEFELLLMQLDAVVAGERIRLCAIPHVFDAAILQVLDPRLTENEAVATLSEFESLPAAVQTLDGLALHDVIRAQFFVQWLRPENKTVFEAASRRLADFFQRGSQTAQSVFRENNYIFHLMGADLETGFGDLQQVYRERRAKSQFNDAETLIRLAKEYLPNLSSCQKDWLSFCEVNSALDNRDWRGALERANTLVDRNLPDSLRAALLFKMATALRRLERYDEAARHCGDALALTNRLADPEIPPILIQNELGLIARDSGNFDEARRHLERALSLALAQSEPRDVAMAYNGLGTLMIKPMPEEALSMFNQALKRLDRAVDGFRTALVLNNIAMAHANLYNWQASEENYRLSLEIKRRDNDLFGQASTQLNIARVLQAENKRADALEALMKSAELFEALRAFKEGAEARRELARLFLRENRSTDADVEAARSVALFDRAGDQVQSRATVKEFSHPSIYRSILGRVIFIIAFVLSLVLLSWLIYTLAGT